MHFEYFFYSKFKTISGFLTPLVEARIVLGEIFLGRLAAANTVAFYAIPILDPGDKNASAEAFPAYYPGPNLVTVSWHSPLPSGGQNGEQRCDGPPSPR